MLVQLYNKYYGVCGPFYLTIPDVSQVTLCSIPFQPYPCLGIYGIYLGIPEQGANTEPPVALLRKYRESAFPLYPVCFRIQGQK